MTREDLNVIPGSSVGPFTLNNSRETIESEVGPPSAVRLDYLGENVELEYFSGKVGLYFDGKERAAKCVRIACTRSLGAVVSGVRVMSGEDEVIIRGDSIRRKLEEKGHHIWITSNDDILVDRSLSLDQIDGEIVSIENFPTGFFPDDLRHI